MSLSALLLPGSRGTPIWESDNVGERLAMKRNDQLINVVPDGAQLSEQIGRNLAIWASGKRPAEDLIAIYGRELAAAIKGQTGSKFWTDTADRRTTLNIPADRLAKMEAAANPKKSDEA